MIVGAGGHGRELFDAAGRAGRRVLGFVDDSPADPSRVERIGSTILGDVAWLEAHPTVCALGIGTPAVRRPVDLRLIARTAATIVTGRGVEGHPGDDPLAAVGDDPPGAGSGARR